MRSVVWTTFLVVATIGGCAEQVESPDALQETQAAPEQNQTAELESFMVRLGLANATDELTAGNVSLGLGIEGPESLNASRVAWNLSFDNGTGNGSLANGTGLPAMMNVTLDAGNLTLRLEASADGFLPANATLDLVVLEAVPEDPCAGVGVQEPVSFSGLFTVAVMGTGFFSANAFEVGPCQTKIFVEVTTSEAALDPMLRLKDPSGTSVDEEDNEFLYHETLTYEPGGHLETGTWNIDVRGYAAGPGNYEGTVSFE